ncbi:MAG: DNA-binding response regulator [Microbacteriaceae bacterium]
MEQGDVSVISRGSDEPAHEVSPVRLALLDDHIVLLDSIDSWISANAPDFDVVVRASTWLELVHSAHFPTELVFLDFQLKESVSIEARVRTCRAAGATVIVLSSLDDRQSRERAIAAGAARFVPKSLPMHEVMDVAREIMGITGVEVQSRNWRPLPSGALELRKPALSVGENEAFALYVAGATTVEVARAMNVKYETAKTYLRRVREKYAKVDRPASRRADLIRRAAEDGLLN